MTTTTEVLAPYRSVDFAEAGRELASLIETEDPRVLYPGSYTDLDIADIFGHQSVLHVDFNDEAMRVMSEAGLKTRVGNVFDLPPQAFDVVVDRNTGVMSHDLLQRFTHPESYILTNLRFFASWLESDGLIELTASRKIAGDAGRFALTKYVGLYRVTEAVHGA